MTAGVGELSTGGQVVIYAMLAMLIFIFAAGIFSVVCPPPQDTENVEAFFDVDDDSFEVSTPSLEGNPRGEKSGQ